MKKQSQFKQSKQVKQREQQHLKKKAAERRIKKIVSAGKMVFENGDKL